MTKRASDFSFRPPKNQSLFDWSGEDPKYLLKVLQTKTKNQSLPEWIYLEIEKILLEKRRKRPSRGERSFEEKDRQAWLDFVRYMMVKRLRKSGTPFLEVWQAASDALEGTDYSGSADTIKRSYSKWTKADPRTSLSVMERLWARMDQGT
jgi:hypothetical protein